MITSDGSTLTSLGSKLDAAEKRVAREVAELALLVSQHKQLADDVDVIKRDAQDVGDAILVVQAFAGQIQTGVIDKFENLLNRGIREIFDRDYKIDIEMEAKGNSFVADIYITLPGGNRIPMSTEGGGLKYLASMLSRILYLILDSTQPVKFLFLDETMADLDEWRYPQGFKFIMDVAAELGIQIVWITHSPAVSGQTLDLPGAKIIQFDLENDVTVTRAL